MSLNLLWLRDVRTRLSLFPSGQGYLSLLLPAAATIAALVMVRSFLKSNVPDAIQVLVGLSAGYIAFGLAALRFALEPQDKILARSAYARFQNMFRGMFVS